MEVSMHHTLLCMGDNIEEQLEPFDENTEDKQYLEFFDAEKECREDYDSGKEFQLEWYPCDNMWLSKEEHNTLIRTGELILENHTPDRYFCSGILELENSFKKNKTASVVIYNDDTSNEYTETYVEVVKYNKEFIKDLRDKLLEVSNPENDIVKYIENLSNVISENGDIHYIYDVHLKLIDPPKKIPIKDVYPVYSRYLEEWCGYSKDETLNKYGHWKNPNSKWDWYVLGGRYDNYFKLKNGTYTNQSKKSDIDFEGMAKEAEEKAILYWEEALSKNLTIGSRYHSYGIKKEDTKESYIKSFKSISTYAVLKDGTWYEKGKTSLLGSTTDGNVQEDWDKEFYKILDSISDDTLLSVYDIHS